MSAWIDRFDLAGQVHTSIHRDGHKLGVFSDGVWAYAASYRYTAPGEPRIGPEPAGPFLTIRDAKNFVEAQGWVSPIPFNQEQAS